MDAQRIRRNRFPDIQSLDLELDAIVSGLIELTGKKVNELPPPAQTPEMSRFIQKISEGEYKEYIKIDGKFILLGGGGTSTPAIQMRVASGYIQWRTDPNGDWTNLLQIDNFKTTLANIGNGKELVKGLSGNEYKLRTIEAGNNIQIEYSSDNNKIIISAITQTIVLLGSMIVETIILSDASTYTFGTILGAT